jgi:hypothetical protein
MRALDNRHTEPRRRRSLRRTHRGEGAPTPHEPPPAIEDELFDERRLRASGGPQDRACYGCTCGYLFEADVSTSVTCPNCGQDQAW